MDTGFSGVGQIIWRWVELLGLDAEALFAAAGLDQGMLRDPHRRIPVHKWDALLSAAMSGIHDPCAGLRASRCWHPSNLGALGYAWLASSSLRTALTRLQRYSRIIGTAARYDLAETPRGLEFSVRRNRDDPEVWAAMADFAMSIIVDMCRVNFGKSLRPVLVTLTRREPKCDAVHSRFYGCEILFSAPKDAFTLASEDAELLLPSSNRQLAGVHDGLLAEQLAALDRDNVVARCQAVILDSLTTGELSAEDAAKRLHMSVRTLNRRLDAAATGFHKLLDDTRRELADRYLAGSNESISEVAFLVGFSRQSSLARAARRWFGMSPRQYRQSSVRRRIS